jgi:hypothetical protein
MQATDDRAPAERIGFLITVASGEFSIEIEDGAIVPYGPVSFYFAEDELPFEGELEVRAIDLNGNIGPPTIVEVSSAPSSRKRFASVDGASPLLMCGLVGLSLVIACRPRAADRSRVAEACASARYPSGSRSHSNLGSAEIATAAARLRIHRSRLWFDGLAGSVAVR